MGYGLAPQKRFVLRCKKCKNTIANPSIQFKDEIFFCPNCKYPVKGEK